MATLDRMRAWLSQWRPRRRRALAKRRLEVLLTREGLSRTVARRVIGEFFQ